MVLDRLEAGGKYGKSEISVARREPMVLRPLREKLAAPGWDGFRIRRKSIRSDSRSGSSAGHRALCLGRNRPPEILEFTARGRGCDRQPHRGHPGHGFLGGLARRTWRTSPRSTLAPLARVHAQAVYLHPRLPRSRAISRNRRRGYPYAAAHRARPPAPGKLRPPLPRSGHNPPVPGVLAQCSGPARAGGSRWSFDSLRSTGKVRDLHLGRTRHALRTRSDSGKRPGEDFSN